jgi:hypothetical protein
LNAFVDFVNHLGDFFYENMQYPDGYGDRYRDEIYLEDERLKIPKDSNEYEGSDRTSCLVFFCKSCIVGLRKKTLTRPTCFKMLPDGLIELVAERARTCGT